MRTERGGVEERSAEPPPLPRPSDLDRIADCPGGYVRPQRVKFETVGAVRGVAVDGDGSSFSGPTLEQDA